MIKVNIESLVVGIMPMPSVITLRPAEVRDDIPRDNVLPIWIGSMESSSIAASLGSNTHERPLTHKLMSNVITAMGGSVSRVVIDRVEGTTFFSTIYLRLANGMFTRIDARPSDAIALAVRSKAPLFVEEAVFQSAGCPRSFRPGQDDQIVIEEFDKFIESVNPEDFITHEGHGDSK